MQKPARVVVVGYENINSLGSNKDEVWTAQKAGESAAKEITTEFKKNNNIHTDFKNIKIAPFKKDIKEMIEERGYKGIEKRNLNKMSSSQQLVYVAGDSAMKHAGDLTAVYEKGKVEVNGRTVEGTNMRSYVGNGVGDYVGTDQGVNNGTGMSFVFEKFFSKNPSIKIEDLTHQNKSDILEAIFDTENTHNPTTLKKIMISCLDHYIANKYNITAGGLKSASACSAVSQAIGSAYQDIRNREIDLGLVIGVANPMSQSGIGNFYSMNALGSESVPWVLGRDGFLISCAVNGLVLESEESALKRGATIYAEVIGYGQSLDPTHPTSPNPTGLYTGMAMYNALKDAKLTPEQIQWILLHATSTPLGDIAEANALKWIFGNHIPFICLPKSTGGHSLGASGGDHSIQSINMIQENIIPRNFHLDERPLDPEMVKLFGDSIYEKVKIEEAKIPKDIGIGMSLSNGFGGINTALIYKKYRA